MEQDNRQPLSIVAMPLRNRRKRDITLRLEPWGESHVMPAGSTFQVVARGPAGDTLEVKWDVDSVTVFGWPGSVVAVRHRRGLVGSRERLTAPRLPEGMRVSEWIDEMGSRSPR